MPHVNFGKKNEPGFDLEMSDDLIVVRTRSRQSLRTGGPVRTPAMAELAEGVLQMEFPEAGVEVYQMPKGRGERTLTARKAALAVMPDVQFAGGVLVDPASQAPVLYTENLFIKFKDDVDPDDCRSVILQAGLQVKRELTYATNAWFVAAPEGTGRQVFEIAEQLLNRNDVDYCHPEVLRERHSKAIAPQQWHLMVTTFNGININAHASVDAAHQVTQGAGVTIAVIDDGVDIDHMEFSSAGKIVSPRDATEHSADARPKLSRDKHGTACAGVACANGSSGGSGVAPKAKLMPIRLNSGLGSQDEADAFKWAADHGADVISCSWGPADGDWFDPADPVHNQVVQLPASTRLAIEHALTQGRGGKGCVILFAAGNGNESVENDGYASNPNVIAVAACNDQSRRSVYSDFGKAVWCAFPSSDFGFADFGHPEPLTPGIWTTDRSGLKGYNAGNIGQGDVAGDFTNSFGGTSSSCPGAAGVAGLVLSVNPSLKWHEVKDILKQSCDRIDPQGGNYNASGHSDHYGFGRLNARRAVELAQPAPRSSIIVSRNFDGPIPDLQTVSYALDVAEKTPVTAFTVNIDIRHTFIGDLVLTLIPPANTGVTNVVLAKRAGGNQKNLRKTFDAVNTPKLADFVEKPCNGTWTLQIQDAARADVGTLISFGLELTFPHAEDRAPDAAPDSAPDSVPASDTKETKPATTRRTRARRR